MPYIIDGYNLLRKLQNRDETSEHISDIIMCHTIARYLKKIKEKAEIIFDGTGPREKQKFEGIENLEVFFAGRYREADDVIVNKIKSSSAAKQLTVVTGDRKILTEAKKRKAATMKPKTFWDRLQKQLKKTAKFREPMAKRYGISESETEEWMKFFGFED